MKTLIVLLLITVAFCITDEPHYGNPNNGCYPGEVKVCSTNGEGCMCSVKASVGWGCPRYSWDENMPTPSANIQTSSDWHNSYCVLACSQARGCYGNGTCVRLQQDTKWQIADDSRLGEFKFNTYTDYCLWGMRSKKMLSVEDN